MDDCGRNDGNHDAAARQKDLERMINIKTAVYGNDDECVGGYRDIVGRGLPVVSPSISTSRLPSGSFNATAVGVSNGSPASNLMLMGMNVGDTPALARLRHLKRVEEIRSGEALFDGRLPSLAATLKAIVLLSVVMTVAVDALYFTSNLDFGTDGQPSIPTADWKPNAAELYQVYRRTPLGTLDWTSRETMMLVGLENARRPLTPRELLGRVRTLTLKTAGNAGSPAYFGSMERLVEKAGNGSMEILFRRMFPEAHIIEA